jgi:hypothetical protein
VILSRSTRIQKPIYLHACTAQKLLGHLALPPLQPTVVILQRKIKYTAWLEGDAAKGIRAACDRTARFMSR